MSCQRYLVLKRWTLFVKMLRVVQDAVKLKMVEHYDLRERAPILHRVYDTPGVLDIICKNVKSSARRCEVNGRAL